MHGILKQQPHTRHFRLDAPKRPGFTKLEWLVVLAIVFLLFSLLLSPVERGLTPARRTQCRNNFKQIGLALHNYHDVYDAFPPAYTVDSDGNRLHSWRTLVLPYIDQANVYNTIDRSKPWNDPANASAYKKRFLSIHARPL